MTSFPSPTQTQTITIAGYAFNGPFSHENLIYDAAGVYVILGQTLAGTWQPLDAGESSTLHTRIKTHDRSACWRRNWNGMLAAAVLYTPAWTDAQRRLLEARIRGSFNLVCGVY